jgi:O-antigen/teichoic acid export membrane protein
MAPVGGGGAASAEGVEAGPVPDSLGRLTRRASLNAGAALVDYAARIGVGLAVTPILLSGLGTWLFGVWEMLQRLGTYLTAADGRPTEALRLVVAQRQSLDDPRGHQRYVGAALVVWVIMLPLVAALAGVLVWLAPSLTHAPAALRGEVRVTSALLVAAFLLTTLAMVPEGVLRGMNLGYKRMGLQAGLAVLAGLLMAAAVWGGLGLAGLGGALVIAAAATGLCFWVLTRRFVRWFAPARPARSEVKLMLGMSVWLALGDVLSKLLRGSDVVILGAVLAPAAVTPYVLTAYAAQAGDGIHAFTTGAAMPGVGGLLGTGQQRRAGRARAELLLLTWLFVTVIGAVILLWNRSFLGLWVGPDRYAGVWVDLLIVMIAAESAFIRVDAYIIDAALAPRARVLLMGAAAAVTLGLSILFTIKFGLVGLCAGVLAGRGVMAIGYPVLVRSRLDARGGAVLDRVGQVRLVAATVALWGGAVLAAPRLTPPGWASWVAGVVLSAAALTALALATAPADARRVVTRRLRVAASGGGRW